MHVPDGFLSPKLYLPAAAAATGFWAYALRRVRRDLRDEAIPKLAVMTAAAFLLMSIAVPLPGGTSVHAAGVAMLAVTFGPWIAFLSISIVLLLQATVFGEGGITALPVNALAMGLCGSFCAVAVHATLRRVNERVALFAAGWFSLAVPAALMALALGVQPLIARAPDGAPRFFPFGIGVTLPALVVPNAIAGIGEGVLTVLACRFFAARARSRGSDAAGPGERGVDQRRTR
ncbi:MAG: energy-coupling factor ABC transporter permease [Candidatus Eisenbacteria bacterium]